MTSRQPYALNISSVLGELPPMQRPAVAARAGFEHIESWWPFPRPTATRSEIDTFVSTMADANVHLVALNFAAGDLTAGERGLLSHPPRQREFRDNVNHVLSIAAATGCRILHAPYGNRINGRHEDGQRSTAIANLAFAADAAASIEATIVIEAINAADNPDYALASIDEAADIATAAVVASQHGNVGLLADVYHLHQAGEDPAEAMLRHSSAIRHVQFADAPGRTCPGTGMIDFDAVRGALAKVEYSGFIGLEFASEASAPDALEQARAFVGCRAL